MRSEWPRLLLFLCLLLIAVQLCCASFVTFIVPSGGRRSIVATLDSLRAQTNAEWNAVVVFDGLEPHMDGKRRLPFNFLLPSRFSKDKRIIFHNLPLPVGNMNCGARVRNAGLFLVRTPWVAFVDDDDTLSPLYVSLLLKEVELTRAELVIFRMHNELLKANPVLPPPGATDLEINKAGISFAYRQDAFDHNKHFVANTAEDFDILHRLCHGRLKCVISPYLTYFVHGKSGNLPVVQGKRVLVPSKPLHFTRDMDLELRFGKAMCYKEKEVAVVHPFVFTEEGDLRFGSNVRALKAALERALQQGCLRASASNERIHVVFRHNTPPIHQKYIQVQTEQPSSVVEVANKEYRRKLERAWQIWDTTPSSAERLAKVLPANADAIYSVPTTTYVEANGASITCLKVTDSKKLNGEFYSYEFGCHSRWEVKRGALSKLKQPLSSDCGTRRCEPSSSSIASLRSEPDVLFYGSSSCSSASRHEALCDLLKHPGNGFAAECVHDISGVVLDHFFCHSKVIVIDSFNEGASLPSHRIDALLLAGKIVVSTPFKLLSLNKFYEDFILLADEEDIAATVRYVVENYSKFQDLAQLQRQRFASIVNNVEPLCYALRGLA